MAPGTPFGVNRWNEVTPMASGSHHERLSALDASFLGIEDRCSHMHIGSVAIFESGPATGPGRGIDPELVRHLVSVVLDGVPRYRQRVETMPLLGHPVWVDDASSTCTTTYGTPAWRFRATRASSSVSPPA